GNREWRADRCDLATGVSTLEIDNGTGQQRLDAQLDVYELGDPADDPRSVRTRVHSGNRHRRIPRNLV
ncbi:hypothetical protein, partial [Nocardia higoensis]|uniref:hypothetical protein n=1 Tax=Nocardia higoensis TaxID=228599 RepID=UPI000592471F